MSECVTAEQNWLDREHRRKAAAHRSLVTWTIDKGRESKMAVDVRGYLWRDLQKDSQGVVNPAGFEKAGSATDKNHTTRCSADMVQPMSIRRGP